MMRILGSGSVATSSELRADVEDEGLVILLMSEKMMVVSIHSAGSPDFVDIQQRAFVKDPTKPIGAGNVPFVSAPAYIKIKKYHSRSPGGCPAALNCSSKEFIMAESRILNGRYVLASAASTLFSDATDDEA